jgi:hypothetical protein
MKALPTFLSAAVIAAAAGVYAIANPGQVEVTIDDVRRLLSHYWGETGRQAGAIRTTAIPSKAEAEAEAQAKAELERARTNARLASGPHRASEGILDDLTSVIAGETLFTDPATGRGAITTFHAKTAEEAAAIANARPKPAPESVPPKLGATGSP